MFSGFGASKFHVAGSTIQADVTGWNIVENQTLVAPANVFTFLGLDINTDVYYKLFFRLRNNNALASAVYIYANNDQVAVNYYTQLGTFSGAVAGAVKVNYPRCAYLAASDQSAGEFTIFRDPAGYFRALGNSYDSTGAAVNYDFSSICKVATITNLTRIDIVPAAAINFAIGSQCTLTKMVWI